MQRGARFWKILRSTIKGMWGVRGYENDSWVTGFCTGVGNRSPDFPDR